MLPYEGSKIFTLQDVKNYYPPFFNLKDLKRKEVLKFRQEELKKLKDFWGVYKKPQELQDIATARAYYNYLWVIDNATATCCSWGWQASDTHFLFERMQKAGIDPWQVSNVTGNFISNLQGHGFVEVTRPDKTIFLMYDPAGKGKPWKITEHSVPVCEEYEDDKKNEVPADDDYDDFGAAPGQLDF